MVFEAIKIGVRHLDCACDYGNEIGNNSEMLSKLRITSLMVAQRSVWGSSEVLMKVIEAYSRFSGNEFENLLSGLVTREDLFITSKLWNTYHKREHVPLAARKSLDDLGISYFDLCEYYPCVN